MSRRLGVQVGPLTAEVDLVLEVGPGGGTVVHALGHPGFIHRASAEDQALREAPVALWKFGRWLWTHGERPFRGGPPRVRVVERVAVPHDLEAPHAWALFEAEQAPLDDAALESFRTRWAWAEEDLADLVTPLPPEVMGRPARPGAPAPNQILDRLLTLQRADAAVFGLNPPPGEGEEPLEALRNLRQAVLTGLERQSPDAWTQVTLHQREGQAVPEPWTLAKLLRRLLQVQREQLAALRRAL